MLYNNTVSRKMPLSQQPPSSLEPRKWDRRSLFDSLLLHSSNRGDSPLAARNSTCETDMLFRMALQQS